VKPKVKPIYLVIALLVALVATQANAAPSDYIKLVSNTNNCGGIGEPATCETIYQIINPNLTPLVLDDSSKLSVSYRKTDGQLKDDLSLSSISNVKYEFSNDGKDWKSTDIKSSALSASKTTLANSESVYIKISATKKWEYVGNNEWQLPNVDNVLCVNGECDFSNAWWNTSYGLKEQITFNSNQTISGNAYWIYNRNMSDKVSLGKLDQLGNCYRIVDSTESTELPFENERLNLTMQNLTIFVVDNAVTAGTNIRWGYYNSTNCPVNSGTVALRTAYNSTGLIYGTHLMNDTYAKNHFEDSAVNGNWSSNFDAGSRITKTPYGYGVMFNQVALDTVHYNETATISKASAALAQGTIIVIFNATASSEQFIFARGTGGSADLEVKIDPSGKVEITGDNTGTTCKSISAISTNTWYMFIGKWNSTSMDCFLNGQFQNTLSGSHGISANAYVPAIGGLYGNVAQPFKGQITDVELFNRSFTEAEVQLVSAQFYNASEVPISLSGIVFNAFDFVSNQQIYINVTYTNSTSTGTTANQFAPSVNLYPSQYTFTFQNASYYPSIIINPPLGNSTIITTYMMPISNPYSIVTRLHVINLQGGAVTNALISINQSSNQISQAYVDSTGTATFYLDSRYSFVVGISAIGYTSQTQTLNPTGNDYTFALSSSTGTVTYQSDYKNIIISFFPDNIDYATNYTIFNYTVISTDSTLITYAMNLSYNGALLFSQTNSSPATGGTILVNASTAGRDGNFSIVYYFVKSNGGAGYLTKTFFLYSKFGDYNASLTSSMRMLRQYGSNPFLILIPLMLIIGLIMSWLNRNLSVGIGLGVVAMVILLFGMFYITNDAKDFLMWGFVFFVALAIVKLRSGQ
jgi:hypothetical protein